MVSCLWLMAAVPGSGGAAESTYGFIGNLLRITMGAVSVARIARVYRSVATSKRRDRKRNAHGRPRPDGARHIDAAVVRLDDAFGEGQAKPHSAGPPRAASIA